MDDDEDDNWTWKDSLYEFWTCKLDMWRRPRLVVCFLLGHKDVADDPAMYEPYRCGRCCYSDEEINLWAGTIPNMLQRLYHWAMEHVPGYWRLNNRLWEHLGRWLPKWMEY